VALSKSPAAQAFAGFHGILPANPVVSQDRKSEVGPRSFFTFVCTESATLFKTFAVMCTQHR